MEINRFTIRVYGLLINEHKQVLLVHEKMPHLHFTKFPGGGLEFGEGTLDCLVREFKEEAGLDIIVKAHLYTTDFFQPSAFRQGDQLMAIYYLIELADMQQTVSLEENTINIGGKEETLRFFWKDMNELKPDIDLTFPIDRIVARKFLSQNL
jgi:8-oxo-dGTP pyrophosphatase MutT (NUDIX family)